MQTVEKLRRYAIIDNASGFVWGVANATSPIEACRVIDAEIGGLDNPKYAVVWRLDGNETGYAVYAVPADFDVTDGQDEVQIAATEAYEKVATVLRG